VAVKPNKSSKQQALETIGKLKETLPIERAQMRMKIITPIKFNNKIRKQLNKLGAACTVESEDKIEDSMALIILVDPGQYRTIDDLVRNETQGAGSMELLSLKEIRDDETKIE